MWGSTVQYNTIVNANVKISKSLSSCVGAVNRVSVGDNKTNKDLLYFISLLILCEPRRLQVFHHTKEAQPPPGRVLLNKKSLSL